MSDTASVTYLGQPGDEPDHAAVTVRAGGTTRRFPLGERVDGVPQSIAERCDDLRGEHRFEIRGLGS